MEQDEDRRQFFRDLGATAEQTVEEVRGFEENYTAMWQTMSSLPWTKNLTRKLQGYAEQDFGAAFAFARELRQAEDFQDFIRIHIEYCQNCVQLLSAQARDFAQTYADVASSAITSPPPYPFGWAGH